MWVVSLVRWLQHWIPLFDIRVWSHFPGLVRGFRVSRSGFGSKLGGTHSSNFNSPGQKPAITNREPGPDSVLSPHLRYSDLPFARYMGDIAHGAANWSPVQGDFREQRQTNLPAAVR
jgi:hypothetical protein